MPRRERACSVEKGRTGACGRYRNVAGRMEEIAPGAYLVVTPVSIETAPLFHFHPGGKFLQITTTGCVFRCNGCISSTLVSGVSPESPALKRLSPDEVAAKDHEKGLLFASPGGGFGSLHGILGLPFMARTFHPDLYGFDIEAEARIF